MCCLIFVVIVRHTQRSSPTYTLLPYTTLFRSHLHDPDLVLLGFVLKWNGRRVVYDVHESYPMVVLDRSWIPRPLRPLLSALWRSLEAALVRRADLTIAAHDSVMRQFDGGRVITVQNFPIMEDAVRSEEHTSELQSLMRISYAVFCLK